MGQERKPVLNNILPLKLGKVTVSQGVAFDIGVERNELEPQHIELKKYILRCLERHRHGDWGDVAEEDTDRNIQDLLDNERIMSAYKSETYEKLWIITEADRSYTTIMFASEY